MTSNCFRALLLVGVVLVLATGCSREARKAKYLKQAEAYFQAGDYDRAEIEYLNLLRIEETNGVALRYLGIMAFEQGRSMRAYYLLSEARKSSPEDPAVRLPLAQVLLAGGKPREARDEAIRLLALQPTNENTLVLLVDSTFGTNDLQDTRQRLASLKSTSERVAGYHVAWANLYLRQRDLKAAEAAIRQALLLDPKSSLAHGAMASFYVLHHDPTNALVEFKAAAELAPPRSVQRLRYVDFLVAMGRLAAAKDLINQMVKQTPDYLPATLRLAQIAEAERRFVDCEKLLNSIIARDPSYLEAMLMLARVHLAQNEPDQAVLVLERALKVHPRLAQIHYQLAVAKLSQNNLAEAAKDLNQALASQPNYPEATMLLAEVNMRRGVTGQAISALTRLVEQRPDLIAAQFQLANAYRSAAKLDSALQIYQSLSRRLPTNSQPSFLMGLVERQLNKNPEARRSFERILTFAPDFLAAVEQLVDLDLAEGHFSEALQRAQLQVNHIPTNPAPYVLLAGVQFAETNLPAAEATLLKALTLVSDYGPANALLSRIYVASGRHEAALDKLKEMVARNTNDLASWLKIAELQTAVSNYPAARQAYEQALKVSPSYVPTLNNLAWLLAVRFGDLKRAYELGSKAHDLRPEDPYTSDTFGWVLYLMGDYPRALALIEESAKALPQKPEVQYHLGMAHYMMGEEATARVALQNAIQLTREADWRGDAVLRLRLLNFDPGTADAKMVTELNALAGRLTRDPILLLRQAAIAENNSDWGEAADGYSKAIEINPNLVAPIIKLSQLLAVNLNNPQKALELARRARDLSPDDPQIGYTLGQLAYAAGDFPWAASLLQQSLGSLPNNSKVQFDFGLAAYSLGQVSNATAAVQAALDGGLEPPRSPDTADASVVQVEKLLKQQPDNVPALMVMAGIQERKGNYQVARDDYLRILKAMPAFAPAARQLAFLYYDDLKSPKESYSHALKAREAFPQDAKLARLLGILAYERGETSRAAQLLQEALSRFSNDPEVLYRLGLAQAKLKQNLECKVRLTQALALDPKSEFAPEARQVLTDLK